MNSSRQKNLLKTWIWLQKVTILMINLHGSIILYNRSSSSIILYYICTIHYSLYRAVFIWLSKGIGFGFGFGFTTPFGWLVYLLWFWFYDSQVKTALSSKHTELLLVTANEQFIQQIALNLDLKPESDT